MLGYSSFFSSGLHGQRSPDSLPSPSQSTPRPLHHTLAHDDTTPTAPATSHLHIPQDSRLLPSISVVTPDHSRPRLRRRRSSLAGASSPLAAIKTATPIRNAVSSVQKNTLRARSGSDASIMSTPSPPNDAPPAHNATAKPTAFIGRLRSGSLGTALRPRRAQSTATRRPLPPVPALPPPTAPLPAVPALAIPRRLPSPRASPTTAHPPVTPRCPLARRADSCGNYHLASLSLSIGGASPMCIVEDEDVFAAAAAAACVATPLSPSPPRIPFARGAENAMQVDSPSPIDGAVFDWSNHKMQN